MLSKHQISKIADNLERISSALESLERISCALERIADNLEYMNSNKQPKFTGRNVPIAEISNAIGKDPQSIRQGLQDGIFTFGYAFKKENSSEYNYFCPDKKVWEELGYFDPNGKTQKRAYTKHKPTEEK